MGHSGAFGQFSSSLCWWVCVRMGQDNGVLHPRRTRKGHKSPPFSHPALSLSLCSLKTPVDPHGPSPGPSVHITLTCIRLCSSAFGILSLRETQMLLQLPASQISHGSACRPAVDFAFAQTFLLPHKTRAACAELPVGSAVTSTLMWRS